MSELATSSAAGRLVFRHVWIDGWEGEAPAELRGIDWPFVNQPTRLPHVLSLCLLIRSLM